MSNSPIWKPFAALQLSVRELLKCRDTAEIHLLKSNPTLFPTTSFYTFKIRVCQTKSLEIPSAPKCQLSSMGIRLIVQRFNRKANFLLRF